MGLLQAITDGVLLSAAQATGVLSSTVKVLHKGVEKGSEKLVDLSAKHVYGGTGEAVATAAVSKATIRVTSDVERMYKVLSKEGSKLENISFEIETEALELLQSMEEDLNL